MLLPLPLSPASAVIRPGSSVKLTSSTAWTRLRLTAPPTGNSFERFRTSSTVLTAPLLDEVAGDAMAGRHLAQHRLLGRLATVEVGVLGAAVRAAWVEPAAGRRVGEVRGAPPMPVSRRRGPCRGGKESISPIVYGWRGATCSSRAARTRRSRPRT